eukprot:gnl/MRDRNA2_/MRDRNA2_124982_c0_seq1.p2 gnl/MRDRNA2_/MRDRNA2_124982_c0~~gnl/MRDRNA2_/MRDRNA2_124982_c0_seq1.p2  ORF type:complete len:102 (+),score=17.60 gnl/MRDRNA2_/MRDRNA2_124982_c0_seq1:353-658(+)
MKQDPVPVRIHSFKKRNSWKLPESIDDEVDLHSAEDASIADGSKQAYDVSSQDLVVVGSKRSSKNAGKAFPDNAWVEVQRWGPPEFTEGLKIIKKKRFRRS